LYHFPPQPGWELRITPAALHSIFNARRYF
jgi:hypothetical protein